MVVSKQHALGRQRNYKATQFRKNTATVYADGEVFAQDEHLQDIVESRLYFSVLQDRWLAHSVPGATIIFA
jgi:hypothetical protein